MSNLTLPDLPLIQKERSSGRFFDTTTHTSASGKELRSSWMTAPRHRLTLRIQCRTAVTLSFDGGTYNERSAIEHLFDVVRGSWDSFLYNDDGTERRVRFADDELSFEQIVPGLWETTIDLVSVL